MERTQEVGVLAIVRIVSEKLLGSRAPRVTRVLGPSREQLRWWHAAGLTPHGEPPGGGRAQPQRSGLRTQLRWCLRWSWTGTASGAQGGTPCGVSHLLPSVSS